MKPFLKQSFQEELIITENLGKSVSTHEGDLDILSGIQLKLGAGDSLAIVGESGSGKSTLLGLLAGLDLPTQGRVLIAGQDLSRMNEDQRAELRNLWVGFVFQSFQLLPALTALENVMQPVICWNG
jgi:putative ABC transport system ATP-binding protein